MTDSESQQPHQKSKDLFAESTRVLAGGASRQTVLRSPHPDFASHGNGSIIVDVDGTERLDFSNNTTSLIHGHADADMVSALTEQLQRGTAFSMCTEQELRFAKHLRSRNEHFEQIRFVNSGTEAVMAAIKAARAITGKSKIAKAEGAYHGTYDFAEVSQFASPETWGSPKQPESVPVADGTPQSVIDEVIVFPFNDVDATIALLDNNRQELACILIDPLPHRIGLVPASAEFISAVQQWTADNDVMFVLDEVISFRMQYGGAVQWYPDLRPDFTTLGKSIGGGFPVGAVVGPAKHMAVFDPATTGPRAPFAGTFSANPMTMTAGLIAMEKFDLATVERLNQLGQYARDEITRAIESTGIEACVTGAGSMFRIYLKSERPTEYRSAWQDDTERKKIAALVDHAYRKGFMLLNTCTGALSTPMTKKEVDQLVNALASGFEELA